MLKNTSRFKKLCKSAAAVLIGLQLAITSLVPVMAEDISLSDTSKASTYKIADLDVAALLRDLVHDRRDHAARTAPGCPEIEQDRLVRLENFALEIILCDRNDCHKKQLL